jgi:hypothetical protein
MFPEEFKAIYRYTMREGRPQDHEGPLDAELWNASGVVYARVFEGEVVYIGSANRPFRKRFTEHLNFIATSQQPVGVAYRRWAEGKRITILAYKPPLVAALGRMISIHRSIEKALIDEYHPRFVARAP